MSSRNRRLAAALFLALACLSAIPRAAIKPGDPLPDLGAPAGMPATEGRVVMLDFFASWCAPCRASFPVYAKLHEEFAPKGLVIVAVGVDEKESAHEAFLARLDPPFFTLHDRDHSSVSEVGVPVMPTSYLFGRDGRMRSIHTGFHGKRTNEELRAAIERLLSEAP